MSFFTSTSRPEHISTTRSWAALVCLSVLQFFIAVDVTVVNVALPSIGDDFGVDPRGLTWVVVGYTITGGGLLMLGGRLGDVFGRRRLLLIGTAIFGAASMMAGFAETFAVLVAARLFQGVGEALALPAAMATIVLLFPEGRARTRALSVWAAVASCGLVLGFVLSGIITEHLGWRWVFLIAVPFILFVLIATVILLPGDRKQERAPLDILGSILLTGAPLLFAFGIVEAGEGMSWLPVAALTGAFIAAILFVGVERRAPNPLIPLAFFRNRTRVRANLATALLSAALSTSFLLFTFYLQDELGLSPLEAGLLLLPLAVALIVAVTVVPRLMGRWGARSCIIAGLGFAGAGMIVIAVAAQLDAPAWVLIPAMLFIAAGMGFGLVGLQYAAVTGVTDDDAGVASGVQRAADQLGGSAGVTVFVGLGFASIAHGVSPYLLSSGLAIIGLGVAAFVARRVAVSDEHTTEQGVNTEA
ncbi:TPA: MFS transporter [Salmonella enterica subsp. enterica serovar Typhimurium]|mgnify:FL=1|uniref:MFS transporter n=1 Tax=Escherichia coli TaxID=562 RepID=UPI001ABCC810|nr:MFS transporter [Escherichia coli]EJF5407476.1 MFS transporter [Salmonella enterica subsp. enterica serovar Heidelberg]HBQ1164257.1 MFS transporter [Klebsiella pneumoniae]HBZ6917037.1 MFS transporter [Salmonella enterica subsp. enterica serovar Typhimurium]EIH5196934.1 MFS transporter [Escherichia coli]